MPINKIRNVAFVGQTGTGKTTLIEKLLYTCQATSHLGCVEKGDTVTDFDQQSIQYQHSIEVTLSWNKHRLNIIDTPGQSELLGRTLSVFPAVETSALIIDPQMPINQTSDRLFAFAKEQQKCQMIIINKLDNHGNQLEAVMENIIEHFGDNCLPINLPAA
ncbi:GTP-binding protein, partial [Vibrio rotiferianus]